MSDDIFRSKEYGNGSNYEAVALVAGFNGNISQYERAATYLAQFGKDVVVYEYDNDVFLSGDGSLLPRLIEQLSDDFLKRTHSYDFHRYAGASLGAGIAWNMQKKCENSLPGIYAAIGCDVAHLVMANKIFRGVVRTSLKVDPAKAFIDKGYTEASLFREWEDLHQPPTSGCSVVLGGLDYIVPLREALPNFRRWQTEIDIKLKIMKLMGHAGVINWFNNNISEQLIGLES